jgi:hypothetical protein
VTPRATWEEYYSIIGQYDDNVGFGQSRVPQVWALSEPTSAAGKQ